MFGPQIASIKAQKQYLKDRRQNFIHLDGRSARRNIMKPYMADLPECRLTIFSEDALAAAMVAQASVSLRRLSKRSDQHRRLLPCS